MEKTFPRHGETKTYLRHTGKKKEERKRNQHSRLCRSYKQTPFYKGLKLLARVDCIDFKASLLTGGT